MTPVWDTLNSKNPSLSLSQRVRLIRVLEQSFAAQESETPDGNWLVRIEAAQQANPRDAVLQYLAGIVCMRLQLWGKAQQLLRQSLSLLQDSSLKRDAWTALAKMAEQREDQVAATQAYREALKQASLP